MLAPLQTQKLLKIGNRSHSLLPRAAAWPNGGMYGGLCNSGLANGSIGFKVGGLGGAANN